MLVLVPVLMVPVLAVALGLVVAPMVPVLVLVR